MFKYKKLKKYIGIVLLFLHSFELFGASLVLDPNGKYNTKLDKSETGVPIVNISTPNNRGISVNEFLEYNIGKEGQVLNNADNVGRSHLAGMINSNPNLGPHQAAGLIVLQVNGSNRSQIEGYLEALSRKKVNVILSNENGIYFDNAGTINISKFTATTGKINLQDGDIIGIDVSRGNIAIGPKGFDGTKTDYVSLLAKTLEIAGSLVVNGNLEILAGSNHQDKQGNIVSKEQSSSQIAIDASQLGGMYANQIKIISTDKGAGVNSNSFIVSKNNKLEITTDGKVKVNKLQGNSIDIKAQNYEQTGLAHSDSDIKIKADSIKLSGDGTQAEQKITLDGNVENNSLLYTKENLYTKDLKNTSDIQVLKDIEIDGLLNNSNLIQATNINITGDSLVNSSNIKAENISASVNKAKNDGEILALNDIRLNTQKLENTSKIAALQNIFSNNTVLTNSGEILSNKKIELNNSDITNSNKILSNIIEIQNATNFNNTGTVSGTDVIVTTEKDIDLVGNLHGENSLTIQGNNILNNGNTTGKNSISIKANDFTNNSELSSQNLRLNSAGNVINNDILSATNLDIKAENLTNNDLIASENDLIINVKNTLINTHAKTIYSGNDLNIKARKILNDKAELIGENITLEAEHLKNNIGTIQARNNISIKVDNLENVGEVEDLDKYESYYETFDGKIIEANDIDNWKKSYPYPTSARSKGGGGEKVRRRQERAFNQIVRDVENDEYKSLLFPKYKTLLRGYLGNAGHHYERTGSAKIQEIPLKEKLRSLGKTTYAKILAGNDITIVSDEVLNKDSILSAKNRIKIDADRLENLVSVGDEKIKVKTGQESMFIKYERVGKKPKVKIHGEVTYLRDFANDYVTKRIPKLDENGNVIYRRRQGIRRPVYENITEYVGRYAYVAGQPSIIEAKNINVEAANLVKQDIKEKNGIIRESNFFNIPEVENKEIKQGNSKKLEIFTNLKGIEDIIKIGKIETLPSLESSLFIKNVEPTAKYLMETRLKHISLSKYYGSDYFLEKVNYKDKKDKYDRVQRLGDAFYENLLIERSIVEKLGTRFLNGKAISTKELIDNAEIEAKNLNLTIGTALSKEQISKLNKNIIWYEYQDVSGIKVLAPKIYLSKNALTNLNPDGRSRIEGTELTSIKAKVLDNTALIGNKGNTYIEADTIINRNIGNQIGMITGDRTSLVAQNDIFNIGSKISASDELNLIAKNGNILNQSTVIESNYNYGDLNRTRHTELENIAEISAKNSLNILAGNYTSIAGKTNGKDLNISAKNDINISSQELSGEQKFGKDGNNFNSYAFKSNVGSNVEAENLNIRAENFNIQGSAVITKNANIQAKNTIVDSNVNEIDSQSRSKTKGFLSSKSKLEQEHREENVAGTLYVENTGTIAGNVKVIGSNLLLGKNSLVNGKLETDSKEIRNKHILEEKKKGLTASVQKGGFSVGYGKSQFNYEEKDKTNVKSNLVLGDKTTLTSGANITATNFQHGDIVIQGGDVVYGARKDERDVKISSKNSFAGLSVQVSSPALDKAKQAIGAVDQIKDGDALGGLVNVGNAVAGTVSGLANNIKNKQGGQATVEDIKKNQFTVNNQFYAQVNANLGFNQSKQESKVHSEKAVVTNITALNDNSKITYDKNKNILYQGTKAQDTTFVYNQVENIRKEAVATNHSSSSKGSASSFGVSANIAGMNEISLGANASASKNKLNSKQTIYENGTFTNVNEVHNNTENMTLSGFNQEGGSVAGNIKNLKIESLQNTSKTDGYTIGGNISVGITNAGAISGNIHGSKTKGNGEFVDNQTTFIVGENSNLKIGNVDNTASIIGTSNNGKIEIDNYTGRNLENHNKLKTVGGSIGTSGVGLQYSNSEKEGIARNTVVGNVEIANTYNSDINYDISKANEITKDSSFSTNVYAENQLISAIAKPNEFKEKLELAKIELQSIGDTLNKKVDNIIQGNKSQDISTPESRSLNEIKETIVYVQNSDEIKAIASKDITKEEVQKELGLKIQKFNPDDPSLPQNVKNRILELRNKKQEEIYTFYDESTGNIFVNENIPQEELRPSIAREWKIQQDFKNGKGKLNEEGKKRATVAGEIAYQEAKEQMKKNSSPSLPVSNLANAEFNFDSEVTADKVGEVIEGFFDSVKAGMTYGNILQEGNDNPNSLDEEKLTNALKEYTTRLGKNTEYMIQGWYRPEYLKEEIPRLAKEIKEEKNIEKQKLLEARYDRLVREEKYSKVISEGLKGTTGGFAAAAATGVITTISTTAGSAIVVGGVIVGLVTSEPQKDIALSSAQIAYIQQYAPEYYQENRNNIVVKDSSNSKGLSKEEESKLLSTLSNYYKTSKTPDEKLAFSTGLTLGGAIGTKVGNTGGKKIKDLFPKKDNVGHIVSLENKDYYTDARKIYTEKEINNLKSTNGSPNKGVEYIYETPRGQLQAQDFQSGTHGAFSNVKTHKTVVPVLRYNNPNPRGRNYIKFDGIEIIDGQTYLIDSKTNIPYWNKQAMNTTFTNALKRISKAKKQNPDIKIIYEFPNNAAKEKLLEWIKENRDYENVIDIIRRRGE